MFYCRSNNCFRFPQQFSGSFLTKQKASSEIGASQSKPEGFSTWFSQEKYFLSLHYEFYEYSYMWMENWCVNSFVALWADKTKNALFFECFRPYGNRTLAWNELSRSILLCGLVPIGFDDNTVILLPGLVSNGFDDSTLMKVDLNGRI